MNILSELRSRFESALRDFADDPAPYVNMVRPSQDAKFGDFQANCAMPLAKQTKTNPRELAAQIVERLEVADLCEEPEIAGPGFINLRLKDNWLQQHVNLIAGDERLGVAKVAQPKTYVVDFSAPNVAKPMHVGHLRSSVIGDSLCRVLNFLGHKVIGDNHIGDWGTQFGMIIFGYKTFLDKDAYAADPVGELARLYRLVSQLSDYHATKARLPNLRKTLDEKRQTLDAKEAAADPANKKARKALGKTRSELGELKQEIGDCEKKLEAVEGDSALKALAEACPDIADRARRETALLHAGDEENNQLWNDFIPQCLDALQSMYDRLDIHFDESLGESYYNPMLADVVADLKQKGIATESEGAVCVFLEGNAAPFIVQKTDGAFTYATTDLATIKHRVEQFQADVILYVVDARQGEHFKLLFGAATKWGYTETELRHVSFGTILGNDRRPFKTRSGDTVGLESLIDEAVVRARQIVDENDQTKKDADGNPVPKRADDERAAVAEIVGIGGIKYADLRHNRESDYVFSWDKMLANTGDTATYMQYAYARVCGIFRRGEIDREAVRNSSVAIELASDAERALAIQLSRFAEAIDSIAIDYRPNILTDYLFATANCFSTFFAECPVLKSETDDLRTSRLKICDLTARVLAEGLQLLGIQTTERM
jgi:arginyl-tRNA synthetase